jgi:hypothetical protein
MFLPALAFVAAIIAHDDGSLPTWMLDQTPASLPTTPALPQAPPTMVLGFPKTGTLAVAEMGKQMRLPSAHEPGGAEMAKLFLAEKSKENMNGETNNSKIKDWLLNLQAKMRLDLWSNAYLSEIIPDVLQAFGDQGVKFIVLIRWPIAWLESMVNQMATSAAPFVPMIRYALGEEERSLPPAEDRPLPRRALSALQHNGFPTYPAVKWIKYFGTRLVESWRWSHQRIAL